MGRSTRRQFLLGCSATTAAVALADTTGEATWHSGRGMPDERTEVKAAVLEGQLYVIGGFIPGGDARAPADRVTDTVAVYDPAERAWAYAPPLPAALHHVAIAATDDRLYVIGGHGEGFEPVDTVYSFDGETWDAGKPMPTPRGALTACVLNDRLYVAGGTDGDEAVATLAAYDPAADAWESLEPMPTPREHLTAGVVDGRLYAIGGRTAFDDNRAVTEAYKPDTDAWTTVAGMPTARSGHAATTVDGRIYVVGGESPERTFDETELYNPAADEWTSLEPMPTPRHGLGTAAIDGDIYAAAGGPAPGFSYSDTLEVLKRD